MSRSIGFVCPDLLPLLLESRAAPFREPAVQCVHLAEELHRRGWTLAFLTPVAGATAAVIRSPLGPTRVVAGGNPADGWWARWRMRARQRAAIHDLGVDVIVRCDGPGSFPAAAWRRSRLRILRLRDLPLGLPVPTRPRTERDGVLWVARLDRDSGADVLLDLADAFPEHRFDVCAQPGAEPRYTQRFEQRARSIPNVALRPDVSYPDLVQKMSAARLFVSTSRDLQACPRTVLAWMHGAVVVWRTGGSNDVLWKLGLGLPSRDPHELFEAMRRALDDDTLCAELRERARRHAEEHFDVRRAAGDCERLVDDLRPL